MVVPTFPGSCSSGSTAAKGGSNCFVNCLFTSREETKDISHQDLRIGFMLLQFRMLNYLMVNVDSKFSHNISQNKYPHSFSSSPLYELQRFVVCCISVTIILNGRGVFQ